MDANVCDMLIGLLWDTVIIGKYARNGFCYNWKIGKKRILLLLENRQATDSVIIGK